MRGGLWVVTKDMTVGSVMLRGVEELVAVPSTVVEGVLAAVRGDEEVGKLLITVVESALAAVHGRKGQRAISNEAVSKQT